MHVSAAAYFDFSYDIVNFILKLWCIIFVLPVILPGVMLQTVKVVFMVYFVVCCRLFSSVLHCSVVFMACFVFCLWSYLVSCCRLLKWCSWSTLWCVADCSVVCCTVQWCSWPALWHVADCSVVFCRLFSGVHGPLYGVLQTVQWCTWSTLWCVADCSGVYMVRFVVFCRLFSVLQTVQWCTWSAVWCVADCSVVYMVRFVVCCRDCSVFCRLFSGVHGLLCGVLQTVQWC